MSPARPSSNSSRNPAVSPPPEPATDLRGKLTRRLSVAGVLVGLLLGILALFDYLASPPEEAEVNVYTQPIPVAPRKEISQPVIPSSNLPEPPEKPLGTEVPVPPAPEIAAETKPAETKAPDVPSTEPAAAPRKEAAAPAAKTENRPASRSTVERRVAPASRAVEPVTGPASRYIPGAPLEEEPLSAAQPAPRARTSPAAPSTPSARVVQIQPGPVAPSAVGRLFSGFVLQAGVFSNPQRAEELHARLALSGVPSSVETRVQVGPFRTRQEAEAAQARLRELGVDTVLVPPAGGKR